MSINIQWKMLMWEATTSIPCWVIAGHSGVAVAPGESFPWPLCGLPLHASLGTWPQKYMSSGRETGLKSMELEGSLWKNFPITKCISSHGYVVKIEALHGIYSSCVYNYPCTTHFLSFSLQLQEIICQSFWVCKI